MLNEAVCVVTSEGCLGTHTVAYSDERVVRDEGKDVVGGEGVQVFEREGVV